MKILEINPMAKPRMTIGDRAGHRPIVRKYWQWKEDITLLAAAKNITIEDELYVDFQIQIPKSWNWKLKAQMLAQPHRQRPDLDNLIKALQDALLNEDSHIYYIDAKKYWAEKGGILIREKKDNLY